MSKNPNTEQRNRDFNRCCLDIYDRISREGRTPLLHEVVRHAIACRPQAFYIDPVYAYNKLCRMSRLPARRACTPSHCMWMQLEALVTAERLRSGCSMLTALGNVLIRERPSTFAISMAEGLRIARPWFIRRMSHRPRRSLL